MTVRTRAVLVRQMAKPNYRATASYFEHRARRARNDFDRERFAAAALRYREIAKAQEAAEEAIKRRRPPAPSISR